MRNGFAIDLQGCLVQVEASNAWFRRRVLPLSIEQLRWRPGPQEWSIGECLDHLNITLALCLPRIDAAIRAGWRDGLTAIRGLLCDPSEIDVLTLVEPPPVSRVAAPPATLPPAGIDPDQLMDCFHQVREHYRNIAHRARGLDLARIRIIEPIIPKIHSLGGTLAFLAAHDRRHMWQSERIRSHARFPRAVFHREDVYE